jgi:hypothetical protein
MAKLQHTFLQGKMNKDLDERLVPNGQYRDASNVQVSTSEGSDVGSVENILGNTVQNLRTAPNTLWPPSFGLTNSTCIGVVKDSQNEKIYWFLTSDSADAIVEYNQTTKIVLPILVDVNGVLNFNSSNLITGVNILEGLLYWTDNLNEPRAINIATFKAGSTDFATQTHVYGAARDFIASDITVIIDTPETVLTATAVPSLIGGFGTGITPITTTAVNLSTNVATDVVNISWSISQQINPSLWTNKRAVLTAQVVQEDETVDKYQVTGQFAGTINNINADLTIESISSDTPNTALAWSLILVEDEPIFKNDFPRFSYRYKYTDSRYSTYAPFSLATFVPGKFEYLSRDGFNEGMDDHTRKITIGNFPSLPDGVVSIEILYKGSRSTNIYIIETFSATDTLALDITSSVLGPIVESAQLLRLFDIVPRKALAQEIIGNRVVYGNYLQNYDVTVGSINLTAAAVNDTHYNLYTGIPSIKTDRDYQLGVSFLDEFGRESPVFTTNTATVSFDQSNARNINKIEPILNSNTAALSTNGGWATHFKYYIKNNTPEYYNLALDRFYDAEDGGVWLSFPSAERNKLSDGQYIRLKKQHDTSVPVTINNRYKVTSIENEAPDYLTNVKSVIARVNGLTTGNGTSTAKGFIEGSNRVKFLGPTRDNNENFFNSFGPDSSVQFLNSSGGGRSSVYSILEGGPNGAQETVSSETYNIFELTLTEGIKAEDVWLANLNADVSIKIVIYEKVQRPLPEFQGRFFAKINPDAAFRDNVNAAFSAAVPALVLDTKLELDDDSSNFTATSFIVTWNFNPTQTSNIVPPLRGAGTFRLFAANYEWLANNTQDPKARKFTDDFSEGSTFKFEYSDGSVSAKHYTVISKVYANFSPPMMPPVVTPAESGAQWTFTLDRLIDDTQLPTSGPPYVYPTRVQIFRERLTGDQEVLSSQNPAVFETESDELADIDLYYEVSEVLAASQAGLRFQYLNWFNCYSFGNGVESDRIRDDYNATVIGKGVRVSSVLNEPYAEERLGSQMIFSGIFNSISGVNNTNQFLAAENITKTLNPTYGTLQKLHARDTDLIALCEDKCFRILANKDALYNADGSTNVTASNNVLGQTVPFVGEYGISKNPESFASFGFRTYFADKARGTILRLSRDGLTDIGDKDMSFYFQDKLRTSTGAFVGSYDTDASSYNVAIGTSNTSFKESVDGWNTTLSYVPEAGVSLNNEYYTFKNGELYEHSSQTRSNFYGTQFNSTVTPIFNDAPTSIKNFKTLSYEGDEGWTADVTTNMQDGEVNTWKKREGIYFNYIIGDGTFFLADLDGDVTNSNTIVIAAPNTDISVGDTITGVGISGIVTVTGIAADKITITMSSAQTLADEAELTFTKVADIDTSEFSVMGIGNVLSHVAPYNVIVVNGEINISLQSGDIVLTNDPSNVLKVVGTVLLVNRTTNTITLTAASPVVLSTAPAAFILFAKNTEANTSGLLGYQATVKMTTTSSAKKELFAVNSEIFISSE